MNTKTCGFRVLASSMNSVRGAIVRLWLLSVCLVTLHVNGAGNLPPKMSAQAFSVQENLPSGTLVGKVVASDPDADPLHFSIVSGNRLEAFALNASNGDLTVKSPAAVDYEGGALITLLVRVADSKGATAHNYVRVNILNATRVETVLPVISLSAPANNASVLGLELPLVGTASDNAGIALVLFQVNGGFWQAANGTTSWTATAVLNPGLNTISVKCIDTSDNHSTIVSISNVVASIAGVYEGLFYESDEVRQDRSGFVSIKVSARHTFSARLNAGGSRYAFAGALNPDGTAQVVNKVGMKATLSFRAVANAPGISGVITFPDTTAELFTFRRMYSAEAPTPLAGQYTASFAVATPDANTPEGVGGASVIVRSDGKVRINGFAGDGTTISASSTIASNGQLPFYLRQYRERGSMLGWLSVNEAGTNRVSGDVSWIKVGGGVGPYASGFTNQLTTTGSDYSNVPGERVLAVTNGVMEILGGTLTPVVDTFAFASNNTIASSTGALRLRVSPASGKATGNIMQGGQRLKIKAVVMQQQNLIQGVVLGTRTSSLLMQKQD